MDYADGNQLDSELLRKQQELGIPPAIENMIGPALLSIQGYEATIRSDWRVTPNSEQDSQEVADALNFRLNQAERASGADRACSDAFRGQIACGIGWVEVSRESDPFSFPYRCMAIWRNEIHWDMRADDWGQARFLRRQRWLTAERLAGVFPEHAEFILAAGKHGASWWGAMDGHLLDGGSSTGLQNAWNAGRAPTISEERWFNPSSREICLTELWYRRWTRGLVLRSPNGRIVEYDASHPAHLFAASRGMVESAILQKVRRAYWLGPERLYDGETPYSHRHFPYVPFFGFREDATGVPYGYVRDMKFPQDSLNSGISKLRWGMSAVRVERTKGAVEMSDAQLRKQVARLDSDILLNAEHMRNPGARFEVIRDYQLTQQHFQMLMDNRSTIERVSNITSGFMGRTGNATSGLQEQTQVEQSNQSLARMMDNFRQARSLVGELLLSMIVDDIGGQETPVLVKGNAVIPDRAIVLNRPDGEGLSNDLLRTRLSVALEDVPSTNSYRGQQLNAMSEAIKSMPPQYQAAVLPFLVSLMDVPFKDDVVEAIRAVDQQQSPEEIQRQIDQAVRDALAKAGNELKQRELTLKERKAESEIKGLDAKAVQIGVQAAFAAMQAGVQIAQMPQIAPLADVVMSGAGYRPPNPSGVDPNFPVPGEAIPRPAQTRLNVDTEIPPEAIRDVQTGQEIRQNTSPGFPAVPQTPQEGMNGIETASAGDNL
jgi:hypothetical protein